MFDNDISIYLLFLNTGHDRNFPLNTYKTDFKIISPKLNFDVVLHVFNALNMVNKLRPMYI